MDGPINIQGVSPQLNLPQRGTPKDRSQKKKPATPPEEAEPPDDQPDGETEPNSMPEGHVGTQIDVEA